MSWSAACQQAAGKAAFRFWSTFVLFALALAFLLLHAAAHAVGPDPWRDWRTAETKHFVIHFESDKRAVAQRVGVIAERVYPRVTKIMNWEPRSKSHIVLIDSYDLANGYSTPLPFNRNGIFLTPPDDGELLDNSNWLDLVILHEFTHIVHLDKATRLPGALRKVFGRFPWLFPNAWQPTWGIEGVAVLMESDPQKKEGRLLNSGFEAYLRDERAHGFMSLREINAGGRAFPLNRDYLYGAYFFEFLGRKYGKDAVWRYVDNYSDNLIPFRVHSNPVAVTRKPMDVLWEEFLKDLDDQVGKRAAPILAEPEVIGQPIAAPLWAVESIAQADNGDVYVVANDGLTRPRLQRIRSDSKGGDSSEPQTLTRLRMNARIDVSSNGTVLIAQPEICANDDLFYDLYTWSDADGKRRLTTCGRYRRASWLGNSGIAALKNADGVQQIVLLSADGKEQRTLMNSDTAVELVDLAAAPDGKRVAVTAKRDKRWWLLEIDVASGKVSTLHVGPAIKRAPHYAADGDLLFLSDTNGVSNVWEYNRKGERSLRRLTHAHTAVAEFGGVSAKDGLALVTLRNGQYELRRLQGARELQAQMPRVAGWGAAITVDVPASDAPQDASVADKDKATTPVAQAAQPAQPQPTQSAAKPATTDADAQLTGERRYSALATLAPRSWFPVSFADRGLIAVGAFTFGGDALGVHAYSVQALWEFEQGEPIGAIEYVFHNRHVFVGTRAVQTTRYVERSDNDIDTLEYERRTRAQWISLLPKWGFDRSMRLGVGGALARDEAVVVNGPTRRTSDEPLLAAFVDYDSRRGNWLSEGPSEGVMTRVLYETSQPFNGTFQGHVLRFDGIGLLPIGKTVLGLRWTEARASGGAARYRLGGNLSAFQFSVPTLNERELALRGYGSGDIGLRGKRARVVSLEWRTPIRDFDRHLMVPPIGINRLSAVVFADAGRAWGNSNATGPSKYYTSAGVEALAEVKLGYSFELQWRVGVAQGFRTPGETRIYSTLGRAF